MPTNSFISTWYISKNEENGKRSKMRFRWNIPKLLMTVPKSLLRNYKPLIVYIYTLSNGKRMRDRENVKKNEKRIKWMDMGKVKKRAWKFHGNTVAQSHLQKVFKYDCTTKKMLNNGSFGLAIMNNFCWSFAFHPFFAHQFREFDDSNIFYSILLMLIIQQCSFTGMNKKFIKERKNMQNDDEEEEIKKNEGRPAGILRRWYNSNVYRKVFASFQLSQLHERLLIHCVVVVGLFISFSFQPSGNNRLSKLNEVCFVQNKIYNDTRKWVFFLLE